jgi:hypothetical protein
MTLGDELHYRQYASDDGNIYAVKMYDAIASANGFAAADPGQFPPWPWNYRDLRHVTGVEVGTGKRSRLPIGPTADKYINCTGTWTAYTHTYTILGAIGERRPASHIGG